MCQHCAPGAARSDTDRARIRNLLALIEHPDALPAEAALRIARDLLAWAGASKSGLRCEALASPEFPIDPVA